MQPSLEAAVVGSPGELDLADMRRRVAAIFVGSIGNLVEWYDFYAYSAFALYFASAFFPGSDPVVQQLNAAILFAIGFIVRPVGGWLFGHLADVHGRRQSLMASVLLMCFGSLMIAVTPSYASIGIAAPVMLGFARLLQGLSLGGEYGTVTGRSRRCGWLDLVALRYAVRVNGITTLALTKLDVLSAFTEIPVCTHYTLQDGTITRDFPAMQGDFHHATPVFEVLPGWNVPLDGATVDELPDAARRYVEFVERELDVEVVLIGTGAERERVLATRAPELLTRP